MSTLDLSPEPEQNNVVADEYEMQSRMKSGANWFYWIAALSLINSAIFLFGGNVSFFAGLAVTQVVDAVVYQVSGTNEISSIKVITLIIDVMIAAMFAGFGVFAGKRQYWAFIVGMTLYAFDGVLILLLGGFLSAAFHAFAIVMIFRGLLAARELNSVEGGTIANTD